MKSHVKAKALARLGAVDLVEAFIPGSAGKVDGVAWREMVDGLWEDAEATGGRPRITINPAWHVVTTLFHEVLHELHPDRSEQSIRSTATRLVKKMTDDEVWAVYEEYRRRVDGGRGGEMQGMRRAKAARQGQR